MSNKPSAVVRKTSKEIVDAIKSNLEATPPPEPPEPVGERRVDPKSLDEHQKKANDIVTYGNPGDWKLICKASSKEGGWMKSTKRMVVEGGWIYQMTTEFRDPETNRVTSCAETSVFVPAFEGAEAETPPTTKSRW